MIGTILLAVGLFGAATAATAQVPVEDAPGIASAPATVTPPAQLAAQKYKTEIVCRTSIETGSLIAKRKICVTRKQWQYINDENERFARSTVANAVGGQSGN